MVDWGEHASLADQAYIICLIELLKWVEGGDGAHTVKGFYNDAKKAGFTI